jgi:hypothetical protein
MPARRLPERFASLSVPAAVFALVVGFVAVVPPLASGPIPAGEAYVFALVFLVLATAYGAPYAAAVAVVTLPALRLGVAGYAPPELAASDASTTTLAVVHVVLGFLYALAAAFVGSLALGAQIAGSPETTFTFPFGPLGGGVLVGGAYVVLQLWRGRHRDPRTVAVTVALGALLAASPVVVRRLFAGL